MAYKLHKLFFGSSGGRRPKVRGPSWLRFCEAIVLFTDFQLPTVFSHGGRRVGERWGPFYTDINSFPNQTEDSYDGWHCQLDGTQNLLGVTKALWVSVWVFLDWVCEVRRPNLHVGGMIPWTKVLVEIKSRKHQLLSLWRCKVPSCLMVLPHDFYARMGWASNCEPLKLWAKTNPALRSFDQVFSHINSEVNNTVPSPNTRVRISTYKF